MAPQIIRVALASLAILSCARAAAAQASGQSSALDSLLNTPVSAASRYQQRAAEAPASVTILTSEDIAARGFRNLQEALESVRGFYVSNDRNYAYLGTRGFSRPTDYNNRILLLVDGHAMNEQIWGMGPVGSDLPLNMAAIDRIEIVRGPGSAIYGSNAMFAVINIVTKTGADLNGTRVALRGGSGASREASLATGGLLGANGSYAVSGQFGRSDGGRLYFSEFDAPATNNGWVDGLDWESGGSALASLAWKGWSARIGGRSREKGVPTGAYGVLFGDAAARTLDESAWLDVAYRGDAGHSLTWTVRALGDGYRYRGAYPGLGYVYRDAGELTSAGGEATVVWDASSRDRLMVGAEARRVFMADYDEDFGDGTTATTASRMTLGSVFLQNSLQLTKYATLVTGARHDVHTRATDALSPRVALILNPDSRTIAKLLYGRAFRAPSPSERDFNTSWYVANPGLRSERIATAEIEVQRRVAPGVLITVSAFDNKVSDLIESFSDPSGLQFRNVANVHAIGGEAELQLLPDALPLGARVTHAIQDTRDMATDRQLSNSPRHVTTLSLQPRALGILEAFMDVRRETGRLTIAGARTEAFTRADLTLNAGRISASRLGPAISARVTNLFDTRYSVPGGVEHRQAALEQDGRKVSLRLDWSF